MRIPSRSFRLDVDDEIAGLFHCTWGLGLADDHRGELYYAAGGTEPVRLPRTTECGELVLGENQSLTDFSWRNTDCVSARTVVETVSVQHGPWDGDAVPDASGFSCTFTELPVGRSDAGRYDCASGEATVTW